MGDGANGIAIPTLVISPSTRSTFLYPATDDLFAFDRPPILMLTGQKWRHASAHALWEAVSQAFSWLDDHLYEVATFLFIFPNVVELLLRYSFLLAVL